MTLLYIHYDSIIYIYLTANLIDGYCRFVNQSDQSYLLKKQQLHGARNGGVGTTTVQVRTNRTSDTVDGKQKKFRVSGC